MRTPLVLAAALLAACAGGVDASPATVAFGQPLHLDAERGVPTLLRVDSTVLTRIDRSTPERAAREVLHRLRDTYGLEPRDVDEAEAFDIHDVGRGPVIVRFRQRHDGLPVFRPELSVAFDRTLSPIAVAGRFAPHPARRASSDPTRLTAADAMAQALSRQTGTTFSAGALRLSRDDDGRHHATLRDESGRWRLASPLMARAVWFDTDHDLRRAWYVEVDAGPRDTTGAAGASYVVDAADGRMLFRHDLSADLATSWRTWMEDDADFLPMPAPVDRDLWPHPLGRPDDRPASFDAPPLVTVDRPWLTPGSTETRGNHAEAYVDLTAPDGFTPGTADSFASMTSPDSFDRTFDVAASPDTDPQRQAATAAAFATVNALHDLLFAAGFDEPSGNAQTNNFGRGGREADSLRVEVQDASESNNASMWTPSDGGRPRLQLHLFDARSSITLNAQTDGLPTLRVAGQSATFGPTVFDEQAPLAVAVPSLACSGLTNPTEVAGRVVLVERGSCPFIDKARAVQAAGGLAVVVTNNVPDAVGGMTGVAPDVLIPASIITKSDGDDLRSRLALNPVASRLTRSSWPARDPAIEGTLVAHEWGHLLTNRLVADGNGFNTLFSRGLSEGWSDFFSLLVTTHAADAGATGNEGWLGAFAYGPYTALGSGADALYFGLRRVPYSSDPLKNGLTFAHLVDGTPLPDVPTAFGVDGARNSQVHATGEVWATMLWECFTALARDEARLTFEEARARMLAYLVASLKLTPVDPTLLEARDALLTAAAACDADDFRAFGEAFARRGAGTGAVAPGRYDETRAGLVESYTFGPDLRLAQAPSLVPGRVWCDDDLLVDPGEIGRLRVTVSNLGGTTVTGVALELTSDAGATFPDGMPAPFALSPGETHTVDIAVSPPVGTRPGFTSFRVDARAQGLFSAPRTLGTAWLAWSGDERPADDAVESFTVGSPGWSGATAATLTFPVADGNRWMRLSGTTHPSDARVVSPRLVVSNDEPLTVAFSHRYWLEKDASTAYDGAMLEWTDDDGVTWHDAAAGPYDSTLTSNTNPLAGRAAWSGRSPGHPAWSSMTIDLGMTLAGRTVRFGWRVACDDAGLSPGWELDDIRFTGVTNRPFLDLVPGDGGACEARRPVARVADVDATSGDIVTLDGSGSLDPDGGALKWRWTAPGLTLADADGPRPTFVAPEVNASTDLAVTLVVTDEQGLESQAAKAVVHVRPRPASESTTVADTTTHGADTTTGGDATTIGADTTTLDVEAGSPGASTKGCRCGGADAGVLAMLGALGLRRSRRKGPGCADGESAGPAESGPFDN